MEVHLVLRNRWFVLFFFPREDVVYHGIIHVIHGIFTIFQFIIVLFLPARAPTNCSFVVVPFAARVSF
jgi:hypothetical protein